jgi:hypothetical protein
MLVDNLLHVEFNRIIRWLSQRYISTTTLPRLALASFTTSILYMNTWMLDSRGHSIRSLPCNI